MSKTPHRIRSWLFAPGDSARKIEKAIASEADQIILDLEDAVAPAAKPEQKSAAAPAAPPPTRCSRPAAPGAAIPPAATP